MSGVALATVAATLILAGCGGDSSKTAAKVETAKTDALKLLK